MEFWLTGCGVLTANELCDITTLVRRLIAPAKGACDIANGVQPVDTGGATIFISVTTLCGRSLHPDLSSPQSAQRFPTIPTAKQLYRKSCLSLCRRVSICAVTFVGTVQLFDNRFLHDFHAAAFKLLFREIFADLFVSTGKMRSSLRPRSCPGAQVL